MWLSILFLSHLSEAANTTTACRETLSHSLRNHPFGSAKRSKNSNTTKSKCSISLGIQVNCGKIHDDNIVVRLVTKLSDSHDIARLPQRYPCVPVWRRPYLAVPPQAAWPHICHPPHQCRPRPSPPGSEQQCLWIDHSTQHQQPERQRMVAHW